jgi:hypothetical protein
MLQELIELERRGWVALTEGEDATRRFYEAVLDQEVMMLFPGGSMMTNRAEIIRSMGGPPWAWYRMKDTRTLALGKDAGMVAYRARALRRGGRVYSALVSSVYVRRGSKWKMVFHQQTLE